MSFLATTGGIRGEDVRDLMVAAVEHRFGRVNRLPLTIEWLSDNGSCYIAGDTRSFARAIGLEPRTTPIESPQSNGMAEAFVRTIKRDYVRVSPRPNAETVMHQLPSWITRDCITTTTKGSVTSVQARHHHIPAERSACGEAHHQAAPSLPSDRAWQSLP